VKTIKIVPLTTIFLGFIVLIIGGFIPEFTPDTSVFTALIYAGLGSSAAVGFSKYWKKEKA